MALSFHLPEELLLSPLFERFPCRKHQIRSLVALIHPSAAPCRNIVVYGTESTGKSAIVDSILQTLSQPPNQRPGVESNLGSAVVNSVQCITGRHLFERTVAAVVDAVQWKLPPKKCETLAQLMVELRNILSFTQRPQGWRFVLVFDSIDRQREAPPTFIPGLARLSETIPCLTCVFIVSVPSPAFLYASTAPCIQFPNYTKQEFVEILSANPPPPTPTTTQDDTGFLWTRFCGAVCDSLTISASRTLPSCRHSCEVLWPRFTAPILARTHGPREFSKLLIASRIYFQDESLLNPGIISVIPDPVPSALVVVKGHGPCLIGKQSKSAPAQHRMSTTTTDLMKLLPTTTRLLLLAAYLSSHNAAKHDLTLFSTYHHIPRKRRGGFVVPKRGRPGKHKRISRKLLGSQAFVLERMLAIFAALRSEWNPIDAFITESVVDGDTGMAIATLARLRLLMKVGTAGDAVDRSGKWRINVGWDVIRGVGRSLGIEVEEWLVD